MIFFITTMLVGVLCCFPIVTTELCGVFHMLLWDSLLGINVKLESKLAYLPPHYPGWCAAVGPSCWNWPYLTPSMLISMSFEQMGLDHSAAQNSASQTALKSE